MGCNNLHLAYADDLAMVLHDLWASGPMISDLFVLIGQISALLLNLSKCVCIPLWHFSEGKVRAEIRSRIPLWSNFVIRSYGKYLGFQVGPGADNIEWDKIKFDILKVAQLIKDLKLPALHSMLLFQMLGISKVQHVAQLRAPPSDIHKWELQAQRLVLSGPGSWPPANFFFKFA